MLSTYVGSLFAVLLYRGLKEQLNDSETIFIWAASNGYCESIIITFVHTITSVILSSSREASKEAIARF